MQSCDYAAYPELMVVARNDAELRDCFVPGALCHERVWTQEVASAFPQWEGNEANLQVASDFVVATYLGWLIMSLLLGDRRDNVRFIVDLCHRNGQVPEASYARQRIVSPLSMTILAPVIWRPSSQAR
ncbi:hypothetical protein [Sphingobium sp.]|uniref:hypothetical protein n=1 Tax=Sphingobium sp. TaxID=1912891 RepID=UPI002BCD92B6|nr:hypothetical protein [Sphingobium sp.]HUD94074.1 hypothetical protein [Sphingobium sp.]